MFATQSSLSRMTAQTKVVPLKSALPAIFFSICSSAAAIDSRRAVSTPSLEENEGCPKSIGGQFFFKSWETLSPNSP